MGKFTEVNKHLTELKEIKIPKGDTKRLHLVDVKARVSSDITFFKTKTVATTKVSLITKPVVTLAAKDTDEGLLT